MDYQVMDVKYGVTGGGLACGPVGGNTICELQLKDETGRVIYPSLTVAMGIDCFYVTPMSTFQQQMDGVEDEEFWNTFNEYCVEGYTDLIDVFQNPEAEYYEAFRCLAWLVYGDLDETFADRIRGKWFSEFEIPMTAEELEYREDMEEEEE